jgi:hypothetical protein
VYPAPSYDVESVSVLSDADSCEIDPFQVFCVVIELFQTINPGLAAVVSLRHRYSGSKGAIWIDWEAEPCLPFGAIWPSRISTVR